MSQSGLNCRLSRIEEEFENLGLPGECSDSDGEFPPPPDFLIEPELNSLTTTYKLEPDNKQFNTTCKHVLGSHNTGADTAYHIPAPERISHNLGPERTPHNLGLGPERTVHNLEAERTHQNLRPERSHNQAPERIPYNPAPERTHHNPAPERIHHNPAPERIHHNPAPERIHHNPAPERIHHNPAPERVHHNPDRIHYNPAPERTHQHPAPEKIHHNPERTHQPAPEQNKPRPDNIYSKPDHKPEENEAVKLAIKRLTGKYDSLGRMQKKTVYVESHTHSRDDSYLMQFSQKPQEYVFQTSNVHQPVLNRNHPPLDLRQAAYHPKAKSKMLSEQEVTQVEMFFRSHKSEVYVCQCVTHMYFGKIRSSSSKSAQALPDDESWTFFKNGVPVLVLDSGESRRSRKLSVVFAECSTGFILWKDTYNHLTNYRAVHPTFHSLHLSTDHSRVVGFSFEDPGAASDFIRKIHTWTSDPNDSILNLSSKKKKKKDDKKKKYKAPNKSDISSPCCFTHITQLDRSDGMTLLGSSSAPTSPARETMRTLHMSPIKMPKLVSMVPPNT